VRFADAEDLLAYAGEDRCDRIDIGSGAGRDDEQFARRRRLGTPEDRRR
jgi:hypothetical protein